MAASLVKTVFNFAVQKNVKSHSQIATYLFQRQLLYDSCVSLPVCARACRRLHSEQTKQGLVLVGRPSRQPSSLTVESGRGFATVTSSHSCWKCGRMLNGDRELFFCECGVIQPPSHDLNYFEIMDIDSDFDVDVKKLHNKFRELQRNLHPDKFTQKSEIEKNYSEEQSSTVNKAFNTLQKPLSRGLYMLELYGMSLEEGEIQMDSDFLMQMMELNESVMEAPSSAQLKQILKNNTEVMDQLFTELSVAFKQKQLPEAKTILARAKYYGSVEEKIKERQSAFLTQGR